ncbi:MAG: hypothetical protein Q8N56_00230 [bacterium]|nr:hypothetical protein [bacterium]
MFAFILIAGFGGGAVRGLVGFLKYYYSYKNTPFNILYFFATSFLSGVVGLLAAAAIKQSGLIVSGLETLTPPWAFIVGYAGGDFLENIYKIIFKKVSFFPLSKEE